MNTIVARVVGSAVGLLGAFALASGPMTTAHAASECGGVTADGECVDAQTLVWCDDGELTTMACEAGEVCTDHENFGGAYGCIGTEYTRCGPIDEIGECAETGDLQWCDGDEVRTRVCPDGTLCGWVDDEGWFDCISATRFNDPSYQGRPAASDGEGVDAPVEPPSGHQPPDDIDTPPNPTDPADPAEPTGPTPEVTSGGAGPAADFEGGGGGGCAGSSPMAVPWIFTFLGLLLIQRRTRPSADNATASTCQTD